MFKKRKFLVMIVAIWFFMGTLLLMGTFNVAQGKGLPADMEKWLKENKIGPFQEDKVDYDALYQAAKKEGKVVIYGSSSGGPKTIPMFNKKYPGIKVEYNLLGSTTSINRLMSEQQAKIYNVDILFAASYPTQFNVLHRNNMIFPWVPPDLRGVIPREYQHPLLIHRMYARVNFYNIDTWPDKPPYDSWWDLTRPEWKGRLVIPDPRLDHGVHQLFSIFVLNAEELAQDYIRVFGKPLKLTTPNAGYELIKMLFANQPKLVTEAKKARYIGKRGQAKPALGICFSFSRVSDTGNPKYGNLQYAPHVTLKPRIGFWYPSMMNIAYKAPHPNAAKFFVRWLFGDEKGGGGFAPWFVPGYWPIRQDVKKTPSHPFVPKLSYRFQDLNLWPTDAKGIWEKKKEVLDFVLKLL